MDRLTVFFLLIFTITSVHSQTIELQASSSDGFVSDSLAISVNNPYLSGSMKVGKSAVDGSANCTSAIIPFQLPVIPEGKVITSSSLSVYVSYGREWFNCNVDLYALSFKTSSTIFSSDYYSGPFVSEGNGSDLGIEDDFFSKNAEPGSLDSPRFEYTSAEGNTKLVEYIKAQYESGAEEGDFVFFRLSVDNAGMTGYQYFKVDGGEESHPAILSLTFGEEGGNQIPVFASIADPKLSEGEELYLTISADDGDNDTLTFSIYNFPTFVNFTDNGDGTASLQVLPLDGDAGYYEALRIDVTDGIDTISKLINITVSVPVDPNQRLNLDAPLTDRFVLTERVWPEEIGEAEVCLWNDDKIAAASLTIDDNIENEHAWWLSMQDSYHLNFTWFVILNSVTSWSKYQTLIDAGNEVQGHDNCDINDFSDNNYRNALTQIRDSVNANTSNNRCLCYAYPCGIADMVDIAREVYISIRGVSGLINHANRTNYLDLNSRSALNDTHDIDILLDKNEKLYNVSYYRAWLSYHYHSIASKKAETEAFLSYLSARSDQIWIGLYSEVARYGQERDSHSLSVDEVGDWEIKFSLSDNMKDEYFNFPLTVKLRINNSWGSASALQNGEEIDAEIVLNQGKKYLLVKAVPDNGQVILNGHVAEAPLINPTDDLVLVEGQEMDLKITATDPDSESLSFSIENAPGFMSIFNNDDGSASLEIHPAYGQAGVYSDIILQVSDGSLEDRDTIIVVVEEYNYAPEITEIQDQTMFVDSVLIIEVMAEDLNADTLTISAFGIPEFANFTDNGGGRGILEFSPEKGDAGIYHNIEVSTSDGKLVDLSSFSLTVNENPVKVYENESDIIRIFPNPAMDGKLNVQISLEKLDSRIEYEILNSQAEMIQYGESVLLKNELLSIDLNPYTPGIYFIRIKSGEWSSTLRIIR